MLSTVVHINVWDAETNYDLPGAIVTMNGTNYSAPFETIFAPGTVLHMQAYMPGYTDENKTVIVNDTSMCGDAATQLITFILSANLVRYFFKPHIKVTAC